MIRIEVTSGQSCVFYSDEPVRFEAHVDAKGHMLIFGYRGVSADCGQDPCIVFDTASPGFDREASEENALFDALSDAEICAQIWQPLCPAPSRREV